MKAYLDSSSFAKRFLDEAGSDKVEELGIEILETSPVRAMDALHIACALEWGADIFASSDARQLSAARRMGLKTLQI